MNKIKSSMQAKVLICCDLPICIKTDTVPGIAIRPSCQNAELLRLIKERPKDKPFVYLVENLYQAKEIWGISEFPSVLKKYIDLFWPGELTIIYKSNKDMYKHFCFSKDEYVAVRMPSCKELLYLINITGPLLATSANISGDTNCMDPDFLRKNNITTWENDQDVECSGIPSTIIKILNNNNIEVLRQGKCNYIIDNISS